LIALGNGERSMNQLSQLQFLYLLYSQAYEVDGIITKSQIKSYFSKDQQLQSDECYESLCQLKLIEGQKRSRFSITPLGKKVLQNNLENTSYRFTTIKGPKVLNFLLESIQHKNTATDIDYDTFLKNIKAIYIAERKRQELEGVVLIYSRQLLDQFQQAYPISTEQLEKYFKKLKDSNQVFIVTEKGEEMIEWVD
jgi:predicted transcriptional regulator